jgi:CheY-like chemotaxis protein
MATGTSPDELAERVAAHYRLAVADLSAADPHAHKLIPALMARKRNVVALSYTERSLVVATADPVSMEAESELHRISSRTVHFEMAPPELLAAAVRGLYPEYEGLRHEVPPLTPGAKGGPRILVVDDDPAVRLLLTTMLSRKGFRVAEATDGPEALDLLRVGERFDLVTLDLRMDQMHGLEVLRNIRSRLATGSLPVIVATGTDDPATEMELFEAGADDFVVKPVDPRRFLLRIRAVLRRRSSDPLADLF